jgi:hypothetical protein
VAAVTAQALPHRRKGLRQKLLFARDPGQALNRNYQDMGAKLMPKRASYLGNVGFGYSPGQWIQPKTAPYPLAWPPANGYHAWQLSETIFYLETGV